MGDGRWGFENLKQKSSNPNFHLPSYFLFLKKLLTSRSHNEYLAQKLDLFVNYSTKGRLKSTYVDKDDSPVYLVIDKNHPQVVNQEITLITKSSGKYEVVLPEEF